MSISVRLPDGSTIDVEEGSTVEDVAYAIGPGLGRDAVAGKVDGELVAREAPVAADATVEIVTEQSDEYLDALRHTAAHVFAQALKRLYPEAKLAIGPWTDDGFYYDIANVDLTADDLEAIEAEAHTIIEADLALDRLELSRDDAITYYTDDEPNRFKREIIDEEAEGETVLSFYKQAEFRDLCRGPHVASTGEIGGFALLDISAAYWRGDESNETLTRVYGTAFPTEDELDAYLKRVEEAKERDHRRIGREMDLFSISPVAGPGLPLYHPNGKTILRELRAYVDALNESQGYEHVETPHLFRTELWQRSGHYENYRDDMFLFEVGDEEYGLKPMNCPGHATIFDRGVWSYRDLPVRYAEHGKVYRREQRGELSGLSRAWAFTIDDGHLFVRPDQIQAEVRAIVEMIIELLDTFELSYEIGLATRPNEYAGTQEIWERAETQLEAVLENMELDYTIEAGDGAFYGPKIDFGFEDAIGRVWDGPTVQLDFVMPDRFELAYVGEDNEDHRPVMIHRALYGSYERFLMMLIEHFNGNFPTWLAPEQVRILPITDDELEYAESVATLLGDTRVSIEDRSWTLGRKIQTAHDDRVPYMLIIGGNEAEAGTVSVRDRFEREVKNVDADRFSATLAAEIEAKTTEPAIVTALTQDG